MLFGNGCAPAGMSRGRMTGADPPGNGSVILNASRIPAGTERITAPKPLGPSVFALTFTNTGPGGLSVSSS
jgi:hypothetical protein